ncbi:MAG: endonuclease/exonuclease/phosphatase family protein [Pseudomonadota bacterium]
MKLATFNIESYGGDRFDPAGLRPRVDALRPRIEELEADILCLQEVNAQKMKGASQRRFLALDLLLAGTPYETYHRVASERAPGKGPGDKHNLVILSRYPISAHESLFQLRAHAPLWQPSTADPGYDTPQHVTFERPILRSEIDVGGLKPLHLFVVHLRAPIAAMIRGGKTEQRTWKTTSAWAEGYLLSVLKQSAQALELRLAVEALFDRDETAQIILTGDFNATGETGTLRLLRADPDDTASPDWAHRRLYQLDASLPLPDRQTVIHRGKGQALDHILASGPMTDRVVDIRVFNTGLPDEVLEADDDTYAGSYHAAMRAQFDI